MPVAITPPRQLALLCQTHGRPNGAVEYFSSALATAATLDRLEFHFYIDRDDPETEAYQKKTLAAA
jgi:hypothetical protein